MICKLGCKLESFCRLLQPHLAVSFVANMDNVHQLLASRLEIADLLWGLHLLVRDANGTVRRRTSAGHGCKLTKNGNAKNKSLGPKVSKKNNVKLQTHTDDTDMTESCKN